MTIFRRTGFRISKRSPPKCQTRNTPRNIRSNDRQSPKNWWRKTSFPPCGYRPFALVITSSVSIEIMSDTRKARLQPFVSSGFSSATPQNWFCAWEKLRTAGSLRRRAGAEPKANFRGSPAVSEKAILASGPTDKTDKRGAAGHLSVLSVTFKGLSLVVEVRARLRATLNDGWHAPHRPSVCRSLRRGQLQIGLAEKIHVGVVVRK